MVALLTVLGVVLTVVTGRVAVLIVVVTAAGV